MQLDYLREFLAVTDYGSITAAADALDSTQPVVSKHMQAIEDAAKAQLFIRSKKGVELTPAGKRAYVTFSNMLRAYDDFIAETRNPNAEVSGQLRLGILSAGATRHVTPFVNRFVDEYPNVTFTYKPEAPEDAIEHLAAKKLDVVFYADAPIDAKDKVSFLHIADDPIWFIVPANSQLAQKELIAPEDVADKTLFCLRIPGSTKMLNEIVFDAGYIPKHIVHVDVVELVVSYLQQTDGFFIAPEFMLEYFGSPSVAAVPLSIPLTIGISFAFRAKDRSPLVSLFLKSVERQLAESAASPAAKNASKA